MTKRRKKLSHRFLARWAKAMADIDYVDIMAMRGKK
jgi:hypothetical protein